MKYDITHAIRKIYPNGAGYVQKGIEYSGLEWLDERPKPSEEEIKAKIQELQAAEPVRLLRIERNRRLAETDWITLKAYSQKQDVSEDWANYMQALRDLPATQEPKLDGQGNLTNVTWPEVPE